MPLNLLQPTKRKGKLLRKTYETFLSMIEDALGLLDGVKSRGQLHEETYERFRGKYGVASQLIIEVTSCTWSIRKTVDEDIRKCVVRFDGRLFSFK